ncbi:MAG: MBL fold metallo-hydrolase [Marvinbryantia sp.]|uniref:MBL fold metallo-hydrolase n=1 Tax=Marvinbryantia sp. TaxID=2496532 RepID=UPI0025DB2BD0|nr:MBL fold metallo-hydrolase [uncultured Marvinbryantia sp.]
MNLCSIASGSSGNCIFIGTEQTSLLVDIGISAKQAETGLHTIDRTLKDIDGILVTHEHSDHIRGVGVAARKAGIPIYGTKGTLEAIKNCSSLGKIDEGLYREISPDEIFQVGDMEIVPFRISHDAADPVAYRVNSGEKSAAVVTDLGVYNDYIVDHLQGLDAVLLEANHDVRMLQAGVYPYYLKQRILSNHGHLSNENAGRLLCRILHDNLKSVFLGHLSKENNYEALAYETVCTEVTLGDNPYRANDFKIQVARRSEASEPVYI